MLFYKLIALKQNLMLTDIWQDFNTKHVAKFWDKPAPNPEFLSIEVARFALWLFAYEYLSKQPDISKDEQGNLYLVSEDGINKFLLDSEIKFLNRFQYKDEIFFVSDCMTFKNVKDSDIWQSYQFTYLLNTMFHFGSQSDESQRAYDKVYFAEALYWQSKKRATETA